MGVHKDLNLLQPEVREAARGFLEASKSEGTALAVIETLRDKNVQEAYYAQGREPLERINALRKAAGLYLLRAQDKEWKQKITWTHDSKHFSGRALDVCPMDASGRLLWNAPRAVWEGIGSLAEKHGFTWGGKWNPPDMPHIQM